MADLLYRRVHEALRSAITAGTFPVGSRLPSEAELSQEHSVSAITVKRALDMLRQEGLIVRRPRLGTFVVGDRPVALPTTPGGATGQPLLGLVVTSFDDTFGARVIEGLLDAAGDRAHVVVKRTSGDRESEDQHLRALVATPGLRGIALLPSSSQYIPPAVLDLVSRQFPVVILDRIFDAVPVSSVSSDNLGGAKAATEFLFSLGHQNIGVVSSSSAVSTTAQRRLGYVRAHAEAQIPLDERNELHSLGATVPGSTVDVDADIAVLERFVAERPAVSAYLVTEYNIALLLREACRRQGIRVPEDVAIVCFDHPQAFADRGLFRFTHVSQDQRRIGELAIEHLLVQIADPTRIERLVVPTSLVEGRSTAPAVRRLKG